jgi:hypothetical protein
MPFVGAFVSAIPNIANSISVKRGGDSYSSPRRVEDARKLAVAVASSGDCVPVSFQRPDSSIAA